MKRLFCFLLTALMLLGLLAGCGADTQTPAAAEVNPVPETFRGLVLKAEKGVSVFLYTEFKDGDVVPPSDTYETENANYYCFSGLVGLFRYKASGAGRYTVTKNLVMTQEKNETQTVMDVTPGKAGTMFNPTAFDVFTDELLQGSFSDDLSQWPDYAPLLQSPHYTQEHAQHQITSQEQMEDYLAQLDDADDDLYIFNTGFSGMFHHQIPMVIFTRTDLSGAENLEEAAAILGQEKPTVLYRAQMHGNEPAGGEAALVMVKWLDGELGQQLLDHINICVIPRQSPDGAQNFERTVLGGIDPNRDSLRLKTSEIISYTKAFRLLDPELVIDGHEYKSAVSSKTYATGDIMLGLGFTEDNTETFTQFSYEVANRVFDSVRKNGLDGRYYSGCVNSVNTNVSRPYASQQGTLFVLLETRGIGTGLSAYNRRIVTHVITTEAVLRFAAENADRMQQVVNEERNTIIEKGSRYSSDNLVILDGDSVEDITLAHPGRKHDQLTGIAKETVDTPTVYTQINRSRIAPTAYVLPADLSGIDNILQLMDKHGITYTKLPEGSTVQLQQYTTAENNPLTGEKPVTFPQGAYVFCKNQTTGIILSVLMEPDVDDVAEQMGTLVQQGLLRADGGMYQLYRYIHDLNDAGFIDYK